MRLVIQKVSQSNVKVDGKIVGEIGKGYMVLVGITEGDDEKIVDKMVDKLVNLRIFEDTENKERHRKLDAAMDEIRMKFGNDKITRASIMNSNARIGRKAKAQMKNEKMEEP